MDPLPRTIGRYQVKRILGEGGMGLVFLAMDPMLQRQVAVKVVKAEGHAKDEALARFRQEAIISARLNHPNVITIHDVGEEPGLGPFMALEYLEGQCLAELLPSSRLDLEGRLRILLQVLRALKAAHVAAIIHRDVKPDNIHVTHDGRVKLLDFGIAHTMGHQGPGEPGTFLGSPSYAAPELVKGEEPSPRSDRYAFVVTAFQVLTGTLPHPGPTLVDILAHLMHQPPDIPPDLPAPLADLFRRGMAMDPEDRPETLTAFMGELLQALPLEEPLRTRLLQELVQGDLSGDIPIRLLPHRSGTGAMPMVALHPPAPSPGLVPPLIELDSPLADAPAPQASLPEATPPAIPNLPQKLRTWFGPPRGWDLARWLAALLALVTLCQVLWWVVDLILGLVHR